MNFQGGRIILELEKEDTEIFTRDEMTLIDFSLSLKEITK